MTWTHEFSEWEDDTREPLRGLTAEQSAARLAAIEAADALRKWAENTPPSTVVIDGWTITAVPYKIAYDAGFYGEASRFRPRWKIYAYAGDLPVDLIEIKCYGDYIGSVRGYDIPSEADVQPLLQNFLENCE